MKIHKILKVFSLVVVLHMALLVMLFLQPGCNSVKSGDTVSMATPVGNSQHSDLWAMDSNPKVAKNGTVVKSVKEDLTKRADFVNSKVAYSEADANEDFIDLEQATFQTASVYKEGNEHFEYTVQKGDNFWKIASNNGVSMRKLMDYNGMKESDRLQPGQTLLVPGKAKTAVALAQLQVPSVKEAPKAAKTTVEAPKTVTAKAELPAVKSEPVGAKTLVAPKVVLAQVAMAPAASNSIPYGDDEGIYEVEPGDSLYLIAMHNNTTVEAIRELNGFEKSVIKPGQKLRIPGKYNGPATVPAQAKGVESFAVAFNDVPVKNAGADYLEHEVQPGEYPGLIARKYNMSLADLLHINDISNPRMLKVGSKLKVMNPHTMMQQGAVAASAAEDSEKSVAANVNTTRPAESEEAVSTINFEDFPVIRVGS